MTIRKKLSHWGKSDRIATQLRERIVHGAWQAGERLPTRTAFEHEFATTPATIQKALDGLKRDGWVVVRGSSGTFVAERPPHRHRVGIVFPCDPTHPQSWHRLYAAIDEEARRLVHSGTVDLEMYYDTEQINAPGRKRLFDDIAADRLAGVFVVGMSLAFFEDTPVLDHPKLRVAATTTHLVGNVTPIVFDRLVPAAVQTLREMGRKRIALVYSPQVSELPEELRACLEGNGMSFHPNWCIPAWPSTPQTARSGAYLLLRQPENERPDAIVVADDYLAEQTTVGVLEAGVQVPEDVVVLVQCNFPYLPPTSTPIVRLGVDLPDVLDRTIAALLASKPPRLVPAPLIFDEDWQERHPAQNLAPTPSEAKPPVG